VMIELGHPKISVKRQCELIGLARSSAYYAPLGESAENLALMRLIDELYTLHPFYGVRQITRRLRQLKHRVNFKRVRRLMRLMGLIALAPKPNLSKPAPGHKIYPYLLRHLNICRSNQVWCMDITYVPIEGGFVYLCAVLDWHSRKVLAWSLSNSLDSAFCLQALREAIEQHGVPEIMNTDQGCQFTGEAFIELLKQHGIRISMDGRGRALDNVFIERLWRTVKYEEIYRREYDSLRHLRTCLIDYFEFYNHHRPHSSLGELNPAAFHAAAICEKQQAS
jgi:putative transposase